jgi:hypothetical protein
VPRVIRRTSNPGIVHGFRSGLEDSIAEQLKALRVESAYEAVTLAYEPLLKVRTYKPDWVLPNGIVIETKGRFVTADRQKHKAIKEQHPDIDLRFIFSNCKQRISKQSKTTYADWCEKYGFKFADKTLPPAWVKEPTNKASMIAIGNAVHNKGTKRR